MISPNVQIALQALNDLCVMKHKIDSNFVVSESVVKQFVPVVITQLHTIHGISLTQEEQDSFLKEAVYIYNLTQENGVGLRDNYAEPDWFTEFLNLKGFISTSEEQDLEERHRRSFYWDRYQEYLTKETSIPISQIKKLDKVTLNDLMNVIGDPRRKDSFLRRGLVVGDVQSGKTGTYSGLICKAADAGYKIIILLTGTIETLRQQTQSRLEQCFTGYDMAARARGRGVRVGVGTYKSFMAEQNRLGIANVVSLTSQDGDFDASQTALPLNQNSIFFLAIKKNKDVLRKLKNWLIDINANPVTKKIDASLLLIDDEADNASINTNKQDKDPTRINKLIREMLDVFTRSTYVGFTATPFANVFINPEHGKMEEEELFPANFIYALSAPSNYIGPTQIFAAEAKYREALNVISDAGNDIEDGYPFYHKHDKYWDDALPDSLKDAVYYFYLFNAIRDLTNDPASERTMMINISRFMNVHEVVKTQVEKIVDELHTAINYQIDPAKPNDFNNPVLLDLHKVWVSQIEKRNITGFNLTWAQVVRRLRDSNEDIQIAVINQRSHDGLDYKGYRETNKKGLRVIAIGGLSLSRGLTLEGLAVTYFYRNTCTYDVLMQMGRWFGYRHGYEELFRIWAGAQSIEWYEEIAQAAEELKEDIRVMQKHKLPPSSFGMRVKQVSKSLKITAANKMRSAHKKTRYINLQGTFRETPYLSKSVDDNASNRCEIIELLKKVTGNNIAALTRIPGRGRNRYYISGDYNALVAAFVSKLKISPYNNFFETKSLVDYIQKNHFRAWDIAIVEGNGRAFELTDGLEDVQPIKRDFSVTKEENRISIGERGRLGGPLDGLIGLDEVADLKLVEDAMSQANLHASLTGGKVKELKPGKFPAETWFKYIKERNPLLVIYPIYLEDIQSKLNRRDAAEMDKIRKAFPVNQIPVFGFAIGFPSSDSTDPEEEVYYVNEVAVATDSQDDEVEE